MKSIIQSLVVFIFSLVCFSLYTQPVNQSIGAVTVPSPNVAAMNKYTDIPVNTFTGVPSINIPIHTIQEGPITVPINLSYHAGGIKLGETASWVGLGWNLSVGGMVNRSVVGIADDGPSGYIDEVFDTVSGEAIEQGLIDSEPDAFYFNFAGYSGKMLWAFTENNGNGGFYIYPKSDLRVTAIIVSSKIAGFEFKTPDGLIYTFGMSEVEESKFHIGVV